MALDEWRVIAYLREHSEDKTEAFADEWHYVGTEDVSQELRADCLACGARIGNIVRVVNPKTGAIYLIGTDCYDTFLRVRLNLPERDRSPSSRFRRQLREVYRFISTVHHKGRSWSSWLIQRLELDELLPRLVLDGITELKRDHVITDDRLLACIAYHDTTRLFPAGFLIGYARAILYGPTPRDITVAKARELLGHPPVTVELLTEVRGADDSEPRARRAEAPGKRAWAPSGRKPSSSISSGLNATKSTARRRKSAPSGGPTS